MVTEVVFLDTTVQCSRTFASDEVRETIRRALAGKQLITSDYVLGEYNATFLIDCMVFHDLLLDYTPVQALYQVVQTYGHTRRVSRIFEVFALILDILTRCHKTPTRENVLPILQGWIEHDLHCRFWYGVTYMILDARCRRARYVRPQRSGHKYCIQEQIEQITCRKREQQKRQDCQIVPFWRATRDSLTAIQSANLPEHLSDVQQVAAKILEKPSEAYGLQNCSTMGDTIILLEAPDGVPVYSYE
jgi:hypothetical protein